MLRPPAQTIPSTIKLNRNIFSMISGEPIDNSFEAKTRDTVVRWYRMAETSVSGHWQERSMTVPFESITQEPQETLREVYGFLGISVKESGDSSPSLSVFAANHEEPIRI